MLNALISLGSPRRFYYFCDKLTWPLLLVSIILIAYGLIGGLFLSPPDYQQGDCFRIIYVHVPCAMYSLMIYTVMAILSSIYLIWRIKVADIVATTLAPIGAFFTVCALITGSIWGKPMWGTWWIWDARLTSQLILLFLYMGYIGLYQAISHPKAKAKSCAILAIVGAIDIPIIHYSVYWWSTLHQGATITQFAKPNIDSTMLYPLLSMIVGFGSYIAALVCIRVKTEILHRDGDNHWVHSLFKQKES